jgi:hypothetical protein
MNVDWDQACVMKNTAARTTTVQTTTDSFKASPPCRDTTFRMRVTMPLKLFDMVGATAIAAGALTPSFPKTGSSDGSRTKRPRMSGENQAPSYHRFSNSLHAK